MIWIAINSLTSWEINGPQPSSVLELRWSCVVPHHQLTCKHWEPPQKSRRICLNWGGGSKMRFLLIRLWIEDLIWVKNIPQTPKVPQSNLIHADWTVHNRRPQKRYPFLTVQQINQPTGWWPRTHLLSDYPSGKHDIDIDWKYLLVVSTCEEKNESNRDFFPTRC